MWCSTQLWKRLGPICVNSNCRIVRREIGGLEAYHFLYRASEEVAFDFSMLCEVGQPWIPSFKSMIRNLGLELRTMEIDQRPWVVTIADVCSKKG
jgi:hypothetical protein